MIEDLIEMIGKFLAIVLILFMIGGVIFVITYGTMTTNRAYSFCDSINQTLSSDDSGYYCYTSSWSLEQGKYESSKVYVPLEVLRDE
jgi:hypothetical protein